MGDASALEEPAVSPSTLGPRDAHLVQDFAVDTEGEFRLESERQVVEHAHSVDTVVVNPLWTVNIITR